MKKRGYRVLTAPDGEAGLKIIRAEHPDVVITDIMMPKIDGRTLCEMINGLEDDRPLLTIVMTCRISHDERIWVEAMTDTIFMEKPFSPSLLVDSVENYFSRPQVNRC